MSGYPSNKPNPEQRGAVLGKSSSRLCCLAVALAAGFAAGCSAQTNVPNAFQGFVPGETVRVRVDKPLMDLAHACFQSQTASNVTVISQGERYCLKKTSVTFSLPKVAVAREVDSALSPVQPAARTTAPPGGQSPSSAGSTEAGLLSAMQSVQDGVLGNYRADSGYGKASKYYQDTMQGVLNGQVSLGDLVTKAEETLKKVDEYLPERAKDSQFEQQISQLRQFVERARSGEGIARGPNKLE
jgi:hypothetical protein